jgi:hypothetical protein
MQEPAPLDRQQEAAEVLRLAEQNLALWDQHSRRVRITLLEQLLVARKRYNETCPRRDDAA